MGSGYCHLASSSPIPTAYFYYGVHGGSLDRDPPLDPKGVLRIQNARKGPITRISWHFEKDKKETTLNKVLSGNTFVVSNDSTTDTINGPFAKYAKAGLLYLRPNDHLL